MLQFAIVATSEQALEYKLLKYCYFSKSVAIAGKRLVRSGDRRIALVVELTAITGEPSAGAMYFPKSLHYNQTRDVII